MIPFMRYRLVYLMISLSFILPGMFILITQGLKPSIDFTGGSLLELTVREASGSAQKKITVDEVKDVLKNNSREALVTQSQNDSVILKMKTMTLPEKNSLVASISAKTGVSISETRFESVGPILGKELLQKTAVAAIIAIVGILSYVAWSFKNVTYGLSAIVALFHDLLVVIGAFALLGKFLGVEVDVLFVTALLTTMSFSVHDTIVVFDRIREISKNEQQPLISTVNMALTQTMGRSLNNSFTIIFMLLSLFLLGGDTVRWFVFALLIGTISGTYSSPFVAVPVLVTIIGWRKKK